MNAEREKLVEVTKLRKYFPVKGKLFEKKYVQAVESVSLFIYKGETLGLVGESGCGKTTLGRTIIRLYEPTAGRIVYNGTPIYDSEQGISVKMLPYRRKMQIIFQDPSASLDPRMTVGEIIGEALDIHKLMPNKKERRDRIRQLQPFAERLRHRGFLQPGFRRKVSLTHVTDLLPEADPESRSSDLPHVVVFDTHYDFGQILC